MTSAKKRENRGAESAEGVNVPFPADYWDWGSVMNFPSWIGDSTDVFWLILKAAECGTIKILVKITSPIPPPQPHIASGLHESHA